MNKVMTFADYTRETMITAMQQSDASYNGKFLVGVKTTKIYCLPSCRPPRKPYPQNCNFYETIQQAKQAGLRACKLCKPDNYYIAPLD